MFWLARARVRTNTNATDRQARTTDGPSEGWGDGREEGRERWNFRRERRKGRPRRRQVATRYPRRAKHARREIFRNCRKNGDGPGGGPGDESAVQTRPGSCARVVCAAVRRCTYPVKRWRRKTPVSTPLFGRVAGGGAANAVRASHVRYVAAVAPMRSDWRASDTRRDGPKRTTTVPFSLTNPKTHTRRPTAAVRVVHARAMIMWRRRLRRRRRRRWRRPRRLRCDHEKIRFRTPNSRCENVRDEMTAVCRWCRASLLLLLFFRSPISRDSRDTYVRFGNSAAAARRWRQSLCLRGPTVVGRARAARNRSDSRACAGGGGARPIGWLLPCAVAARRSNG